MLLQNLRNLQNRREDLAETFKRAAGASILTILRATGSSASNSDSAEASGAASVALTSGQHVAGRPLRLARRKELSAAADCSGSASVLAVWMATVRVL